MYLLAAIATRRDLRSGERVLLLDEDGWFDERVVRLFGTLGVSVDRCTESGAVLDALSSGRYAVLLTHDGPGRTRGLDLVYRLHDSPLGPSYPGVGAIVLSTGDSLESATTAIERGIFDFMTRDFGEAALLEHLADAARRALSGPASTSPPSAVQSHYARAGTSRPLDLVRDVLVGDSPALVQARAELHAATNDDLAVSLCGEPGTEKLGAARLLHDLSPRRDEPFVMAEPSMLLDPRVAGGLPSQLKAAARGTFFVPELRELGALVAEELLEWIEHPGALAEEPSARIVFGHEASWGAQQGLSRRLAGARVHWLVLPPLRERGRDVLVLADHFAESARPGGGPPLGMTASASETLLAYDWPGNVDELRSAIQHAAAMCAESLIRVADLPPAIVARARPRRDERSPELKVQSLEDMGLSYITSVLDAVGGNKASAARLLRVDRTTLYRKLQRQEQAATPVVVEAPPAAPRSRR
jgi:two-component system response regulator AtoC